MDIFSSIWCYSTNFFTSSLVALSKQQCATTAERKHLALTTVSLVITAYFLWRATIGRQRLESEVKQASGSLPFLGHAIKLAQDPVAFINRSREERGPAFRIKILGRELYVVTGALIREVYQNPKVYSFRDAHKNIAPIDRLNRISYEHKFEGEKLGPRDKHPVIYGFQQNLKAHQIGIFSERIQLGTSIALNEHLSLRPGEKKTLNVADIITMTVSQIVCLCFAGRSAASNPVFVKETANFTKNVIKAGFVFSLLPGWIAKPIVKRYFSVEHVFDLVMDTLVPELEKIRAGESSHDGEPTMMSIILDMPKPRGGQRTPQETAYHFPGSAMASIHTSVQFIVFALFELACRPKLVEELRYEIEKLNERTPESVGRIKLLDSFLREVFRCKSSVLATPHRTMQDAVLSTGETIPSGSFVITAALDAHTNPAIATETAALGNSSLPLDQFDPHRFVDTDEKGNSKQSSSIGLELLTFGLSVHACPGRFFAVNEIKYIIAEIIMRCNITTESGERPKDNGIFGMFLSPPRDPLVFEGRA